MSGRAARVHAILGKWCHLGRRDAGAILGKCAHRACGDVNLPNAIVATVCDVEDTSGTVGDAHWLIENRMGRAWFQRGYGQVAQLRGWHGFRGCVVSEVARLTS